MAQSSMESNLMSEIVYTKLHQLSGMKFSVCQVSVDQNAQAKGIEFGGYF